jgi:Na+-transporting NADH:ubiquinone oxidoreductase subunit NqrF
MTQTSVLNGTSCTEDETILCSQWADTICYNDNLACFIVDQLVINVPPQQAEISYAFEMLF